MNRKYNVFLVSDSTGETLDRIFLALKAQFENFNNSLHHFSFVRTDAQITTLLEKCNKVENPIILYTLVEASITSFLIQETERYKIPCFGVLDYLIPKFETVLNRKANRKPSGQHILNKEYYRKIAAMQFSIEHDDGQKLETILESDIIILGISRTSKTPTTIYLANRGYKAANIPMIPNQRISEDVLKNKNDMSQYTIKTVDFYKKMFPCFQTLYNKKLFLVTQATSNGDIFRINNIEYYENPKSGRIEDIKTNKPFKN